MISKKLFIKTYGCQMNVYDSVRMQDLLAPFGYEITDNISDANVTIINTCHIREKASEKLFSELGRIKKVMDQQLNKMIIVVAGCVAQAEGDEIFARAPYVNIVVGPQSYHNLPLLISKIANKEKTKAIDLDFILEEKFDLLQTNNTTQGASAFVSVQEGCDKFCTFCVVPYTRGAEFSRPLEQVYREVLNMVSGGAKEVQLLGQNVNAYHGIDANNKVCSLADLIKYISNIPKLERIRYTTSHPIDMTDDLINLFHTEPKLMPYLHLPIQSGSNNVLKAMNRKHDRDFYLSIIEKVRKANPEVALSSDFIVGFPGETDSDFDDTIDLVKQVKYSQCYSFKYSIRPGTPSALKDQVPEEIKTKRLSILQDLLNKQQLEFNNNCIGKVMPVLFTKEGKLQGQVLGKSPYMQSVYVYTDDDNLYNQIINVKITSASLNSLTGTVC